MQAPEQQQQQQQAQQAQLANPDLQQNLMNHLQGMR